jgi:hypothetical protein
MTTTASLQRSRRHNGSILGTTTSPTTIASTGLTMTIVRRFLLCHCHRLVLLLSLLPLVALLLFGIIIAIIAIITIVAIVAIVTIFAIIAVAYFALSPLPLPPLPSPWLSLPLGSCCCHRRLVSLLPLLPLSPSLLLPFLPLLPSPLLPSLLPLLSLPPLSAPLPPP